MSASTDNASSELEPLFVEENNFYKFSLWLQNGQMECVGKIEIIPIDAPIKKVSSEDIESTNRKSNDPEIEVNAEPNNIDEVETANQTDEDAPPTVIENPAPIITPPEIFWFLQQNNIVQTIDYAAVYDFCAAVEMGTAMSPVVLAQGVEPIAGVDGRFELSVKTTGDDVEFTEDEDGSVDLRKRNAFTEIEIGQKLGTVYPPQDGINGTDVFGMVVMAPKGAPFELLGGEGVELKFDDRVAFATKSGRALLDKQTVSVVDQLIVSGDVDLSVGDIEFNGFVEVGGDVPDDFDIKATKGVKVGGVIGACHIESVGSVEIASMAGKEIGRILCQGDLHATYLNQVTVQCFGDVYVTNEIRNSVVKATGKIIVERGAIVGGSCVALDGIEAKDLGASSGLRTKVTAGVYFPDVDRFEYLRSQLATINRQSKSITTAMVPLKRNLGNNDTLAEAATKRLEILEAQLAKIEAEKETFSAEINASTPQEFENKNPKINVFDKLMEGVCMVLGQTTEEIKIARRGPLSIIENSRDGSLYYLALTPMQKMAGELEKEIIAAEQELAANYIDAD